MDTVFELKDDYWRGLGMIPLSGLKLRHGFAGSDIEKILPLDVPFAAEPKGCICGMILRGLKTPPTAGSLGINVHLPNRSGHAWSRVKGPVQTYYKYRS